MSQNVFTGQEIGLRNSGNKVRAVHANICTLHDLSASLAALPDAHVYLLSEVLKDFVAFAICAEGLGFRVIASSSVKGVVTTAILVRHTVRCDITSKSSTDFACHADVTFGGARFRFVAVYVHHSMKTERHMRTQLVEWLRRFRNSRKRTFLAGDFNHRTVPEVECDVNSWRGWDEHVCNVYVTRGTCWRRPRDRVCLCM